MCSHGDTVPVEVTVMAGLAHEGRDTRKVKPIDRCIVPIVKALDEAGIYMTGSCCGHDKRTPAGGYEMGEIRLADGRIIHIQRDPGVWTMSASTEVPVGENTALAEHVTVRTRYVGQHLRVLLERRVERYVPGDPDAEVVEHVPQAELIIEAGTKVTIGRHGVRVEPLEG